MMKSNNLTLTVEKVQEGGDSQQKVVEGSLRGRGNREDNESSKLDKQAKRALKRKLLR